MSKFKNLSGKDIDKGLLKAIYKQVSAYVPEKDIRNYFYTE